jgi:hypothetical protein
MRKVSKKRITEEQMRHYFMERSNSIISILIISGSISFASYFPLRIFFHINEPRFLLGGILLIIGNFLRECSTEITDKDYDEWLKQQRHADRHSLQSFPTGRRYEDYRSQHHPSDQKRVENDGDVHSACKKE